MRDARRIPVVGTHLVLTVGPKIPNVRKIIGTGSLIYAPNLPIGNNYEDGVRLLAWLWKNEEIGFCAVQISELLDVDREAGRSEIDIRRLQAGLNHLVRPGWLEPIIDDARFVSPGRHMLICLK